MDSGEIRCGEIWHWNTAVEWWTIDILAHKIQLQSFSYWKIWIITTITSSLTTRVLNHSGSGVVLHWFFNPAPALAPAGFEFINATRSGSGRIWKIRIRYIPRNQWLAFNWLQPVDHQLQEPTILATSSSVWYNCGSDADFSILKVEWLDIVAKMSIVYCSLFCNVL